MTTAVMRTASRVFGRRIAFPDVEEAGLCECLLEGRRMGGVAPDAIAEAHEQSLILDAALQALSPREEMVLRHSFEADRGTGARKIAQRLGVSTARVYQIRLTALRRLRHPTRYRRLAEFFGVRETAGPGPQRQWTDSEVVYFSGHAPERSTAVYTVTYAPPDAAILTSEDEAWDWNHRKGPVMENIPTDVLVVARRRDFLAWARIEASA